MYEANLAKQLFIGWLYLVLFSAKSRFTVK